MSDPAARLRYVAPWQRPRHALPGGRRLVVWPVVNVEHWSIANPMPRQALVAPTGAALQPDLPNWAWHEYGMRVGFWRFLDMFDRLRLRPTLSVNASVVGAYPEVARAARDAGWEFMGHGWLQVPTHRVADQAGMIARVVAEIEGFTGRRCTGWLGPGLTQTPETPDLLAAAGIEWTGDFVVDDLPARVETAHGPLLALPYSVELNDVPVVAIQHGDEDALPRRARLQVARLVAEADASGSVKATGIAIHPYLSGVPHRIAALEALFAELAADPRIAFMQGDEIARWYLASGDPA
ncbi:MAG: polysaccharide deacetylase [Alphaproteobacteria bacterium]|nr:polysaccharide deacetylase [Alphaproteobacteria bacterium]MBM3626205.1 polysaccharide deacetylase [Alphaproteobacteria bacterium]